MRNDDFEKHMPEPTGPSGEAVEVSHVSARVPEKVSGGVFSNGVLVAEGVHEFVLDFVQRIVKPHQLVARVIVPPRVLPGFVQILGENLRRFQASFGPIPSPAGSPSGPKQPIVEVFDDLKLTDDILCGVYANSLMVTHSQAEFCLDFICSFYPRPIVACRVFLAAPQIPGLLQSLVATLQRHQQRGKSA